MKIIEDFKAFAVKGNVVDMAVGVIIGGAFGKVVSSLVSDMLMPPIGVLLGGVDFKQMFFSLNGQSYATLQAAKDAGAPTLNYGIFFNQIIDFLIVTTAIFMMIRGVSALRRREEAKPAPAAPPSPSKEEVLLEEIRDLLKKERR